MHTINLHCPKCMFKGKLLKLQCWLRPLVHLKRCNFLILWSILLKHFANCAKRIAFNNNTQILCRYVEIYRKIKTALPVYFLLPLSIHYVIMSIFIKLCHVSVIPSYILSILFMNLFPMMIHWWVRKPSRGPNNFMFWAMTEAEGEVVIPWNRFKPPSILILIVPRR